MRRLRVLVVDDSAVVRRLVADAVSAHPDLEVAGVAQDGRVALERIAAGPPDLVTLDVEMPVLDGLQTLRELKRLHPRLPVLMFSSHTERGALATLDALAAGASDFVAKPQLASPEAARAFMDREVVPRLLALGQRGEARQEPRAPRPAPGPPPGPGGAPPAATSAATSAASPGASPGAAPGEAPPAAPARRAGRGPQRVEVVVVGVSTGGPQALERILPRLPAHLAVPVLVVQHMPVLFTRLLAERLTTLSKLPVREAGGGEPLVPGGVLVAPGGRHLLVARHEGRPVAQLGDGPPENSCRPAADVLFRSAAAAFGPGVLAIVLTGMGRDGTAGASAVRARGGAVLAQDRQSSTVWGMPGAVVSAGLADEVLPLDDLADEITARVARGLRAAARGAP